MQLWIGNLAPDTTDDELRELVRKYAKLEIARIAREEGDGSRPGAVLEFEEGEPRRASRGAAAPEWDVLEEPFAHAHVPL